MGREEDNLRRMLWRWLALVLAIAVVLVSNRSLAQQPKGASRAGAAVSPPGSTPVLTFETDDADEQSDAFTAALRAKVRITPGWVLSENSYSLAILTAALKCRVDAACLQRIGDQMKTDKFFWGRVSRLGKTQIVVEAHYWQRGKHDSVTKETYSDDLRDPASDALKKIANRVFERLTNTMTTGTVAVQAGRGGGAVLVDGAEAATLSSGVANLELKAGAHTLEVRSPGFLPLRQTINVVVGAETPVSFTLVPAEDAVDERPVSAPPSGAEPHRTEAPSNGERKIVAYSLMGGGVVAVAVGAVFAVRWFNKNSQVDDLKKDQYGIGFPGATVSDPCAGYPGAPAAAAQRMADACQLGKDAVPLSTVAWIAGGAGAALIGTGAVLLLTGGDGRGEGSASSARGTRSRSKERRDFAISTPTIGLAPNQGMIRLGGTF